MGSEVIRRYGILNTGIEPGETWYGIPFPGTFILDAEGRVVERIFEESYRTRFTGRGLVERLGAEPTGNATRIVGEHLAADVVPSDTTLAPGQELLLTLEVTAGEGIHVYAPGDHPYRTLRLVLDPESPFVAQEPLYPEAEPYRFEPLFETVPVFTGSFRVRQPVVLVATRELAGQAREPGATVTLAGRLEYQACDAETCFLPASVPVSLTFGLRPLEPPAGP